MKKCVISKKEAKFFLEDLKNEIESKSKLIKIEYFSDHPYILGNTIENDDGTLKINVYREKFGNIDLFNKIEKANLMLFALSVVTTLHECRHAQQSGKYPLEISINDKVLLSNFVCKQNDTWYTQHYTEHPSEIDAEVYGISEAFNKIEAAFPGYGEEMVLSYVNYRVKADIDTDMKYYIHSDKLYNCLDDVFKDFEIAAIKADLNPRIYDMDADYSLCLDTVAVGMNIRDYNNSIRREHIDILDKAQNGIESDKLMATFVNYSENNARLNPLMGNMDFDFEEIYGIPPAQEVALLHNDMQIHKNEIKTKESQLLGQIRYFDDEQDIECIQEQNDEYELD